MTQPGYDEAVASWAAHLRSGGTTTWSAWRSGDHVPAAPLHPTPDAIHLELVRRLNLAADPTGLADLADLVLTTGTPGRGRIDVPLPWPLPETEPHRFGSPPIEPDQVPVEELNRLVVGVLARLLPGVPPRPTEPEPARWPLPWRRRFRLHGSPGTVAVVRRMLLDQGLVESDWRPVHVVLGRPVEVMLGEHWAARTRHGGSVTLGTVWRRTLTAGRLPRGLDLPTVARRLDGRRHEPVHVVLGRDTQHVASLTAGVLGARETVLGPAADPTTDPALSDLTRRLNRLLTLTQGPDRVRELATTLAETVLEPTDRSGTGYPPPPPAARSWITDLAARMATDLSEAGYAVHGDLGDLSPHRAPPRAPHRGVHPEPTLGLALTACLRAWLLQGGT